jgi:hypothetical protein
MEEWYPTRGETHEERNTAENPTDHAECEDTGPDGEARHESGKTDQGSPAPLVDEDPGDQARRDHERARRTVRNRSVGGFR